MQYIVVTTFAGLLFSLIHPCNRTHDSLRHRSERLHPCSLACGVCRGYMAVHPMSRNFLINPPGKCTHMHLLDSLYLYTTDQISAAGRFRFASCHDCVVSTVASTFSLDSVATLNPELCMSCVRAVIIADGCGLLMNLWLLVL